MLEFKCICFCYLPYTAETSFSVYTNRHCYLYIVLKLCSFTTAASFLWYRVTMVSGPLSITIPVCILILCSGTCEGKKKNEGILIYYIWFKMKSNIIDVQTTRKIRWLLLIFVFTDEDISKLHVSIKKLNYLSRITCNNRNHNASSTI